MRIGTRYKIARRLGADIFPKAQSAKYGLRAGKPMVKGYGRSEYGAQLKEKQRARFFYGLGERQFARYVENAIAKNTMRDHQAPVWLRFDLQKGEGTIVGTPKLVRTELPFNIAAILEFYRR